LKSDGARRSLAKPGACPRKHQAHPRRFALRRTFSVLYLLAMALAVLPSPRPGSAQVPEFSEAFLSDEDNIRLGQELWRQQCVKCHGSSSYPGKAPKLNPARMDPDEIYLKTTYGFGRMPAWEDVFTDEERMAITAYMKSSRFSP
jgi:mono/diheme cytochrome c family protein